MTTEKAAKQCGISVGTFYRRAKALKLRPASTIQTGKRGRPASDWTLKQVLAVAK